MFLKGAKMQKINKNVYFFYSKNIAIMLYVFD